MYPYHVHRFSLVLICLLLSLCRPSCAIFFAILFCCWGCPILIYCYMKLVVFVILMHLQITIKNIFTLFFSLFADILSCLPLQLTFKYYGWIYLYWVQIFERVFNSHHFCIVKGFHVRLMLVKCLGREKLINGWLLQYLVPASITLNVLISVRVKW